ncbi:hypothetical protein H6P81_006066 [Aristolochia fimbriata]|uniref:Uncharacterized protein n=1 Tax=Aristolochia fimbriata TaxID=158543 RepID=A0AAV7EZU2_ARIFI|nr:hypothetical protein H6P81_006066 [Aristolochia fimbriata]
MVVPEEFTWHTRQSFFEDFEEAGRYTGGSSHISLPHRELAWRRRRESLVLLDASPLCRWNVRRTNATNPGGNLVLYRRVGPPVSYQVTPPEDVEHVTRISRKGRAGEDWALYHHDYIARWEARA